MQLYFYQQQSHEFTIKMQIEHTSDLSEDKSEIDKGDGALRQSTRCFDQHRLHGQPTQHVSQQSSKQSHGQLRSQPQKSQRCLEKWTQGSSTKSQRNSTCGQPLTSIFVPKSTTSLDWSLLQNSTQSDHALTKVNAGQASPETLTTNFWLQWISSFLLR